jgi:hypothetical protein
MTPTPKLRWVERTLNAGEAAKQNLPAFHTMRILQQLWMPTDEPYDEWLKIKDGVWKDVPCERE